MIALGDLLLRFDSVKDNGHGQYMARCPCHDDHKASLAIRMGDTGKIVLNCRAGCATEDILAMKQLTMKDLTPDNATMARQKKSAVVAQRKRTPVSGGLKVGGDYVQRWEDAQTGEKHETREKITREYVYQDAAGKPLIKVFRTEQKSFPVIHCFEGKWYWGDGGITHWLYRLPKVLKGIADKQPIFVVEGEKDAETLESLGFTATTDKGGAGKTSWGEEALRPLKGARVVIIPDIDEPGRKYGRMIAKALKAYADEVRLVDLRKTNLTLPDKCDISDIAAMMPAEQCKALIERMVHNAPVLFKRVTDSDYAECFMDVPGCKVADGRIYAPYKDGYIPLCNFVALPIEETTLDNGDERRIRLRIVGWSDKGRRLNDALVYAEKFAAMNWVIENWALAACIEPGNSTRDRLRAILQKVGDANAVRKVVYTHTGWRLVDGRPIYLHAGGAIGAEDVGVELDYGFNEKYVLDGMTSGDYATLETTEKRRYAMSYTLRCLSVAGQHVGVPLVAFMFLSPLRHFLEKAGYQPSFVPFLRGRTGSGKSTIAALILRHFGSGFNIRSMPASFKDTANAISLKLYTLKDMPLLVDDYHPDSNPMRKRIMDTVAQEVGRMMGDGTVRSRMRADSTGQVDRAARGTVFETGEDLPDVTYSGGMRMYVIDVGVGDVPIGSEDMLDIEARAREGVLTETMRGYIEWLIPQYTHLPDMLCRRYEELRAKAHQKERGKHKRLPDTAAHLMLGIEMLLKYAVSLEVFEEADVPLLMEKYWAVVLGNIDKQDTEMKDEKPTQMYLDTIRELLIAERCHVVDLTNNAVPKMMPPNHIGYFDKERYYFIPSLTLGAVQKVYQDQGAVFPLGKIMLGRMLAEDGLLIPDPGTGKSVRQLKRGKIHGWFQWIPREYIDGKPKAEQLGMVEVMDADDPFIKGE